MPFLWRRGHAFEIRHIKFGMPIDSAYYGFCPAGVIAFSKAARSFDLAKRTFIPRRGKV